MPQYPGNYIIDPADMELDDRQRRLERPLAGMNPEQLAGELQYTRGLGSGPGHGTRAQEIRDERRIQPTLTLEQVQRRGGADMDRYDIVSDDAQTTGPLAGRTQGSSQYQTPKQASDAINMLQKRDQATLTQGGRFGRGRAEIGVEAAGGKRNAIGQVRGSKVNVLRGASKNYGGRNFIVAQQLARGQAQSDLAVGYRQALEGQDWDRANKTAEELYRSGYDADSIRRIQAEVADQRDAKPEGEPGDAAYIKQIFDGADKAIMEEDAQTLRRMSADLTRYGFNREAANLNSQAASIERKTGKAADDAADLAAQPQEATPEAMSKAQEMIQAGDVGGAVNYLTPLVGPNATEIVKELAGLAKSGQSIRKGNEPPEDTEYLAEMSRLEQAGDYEGARQLALENDNMAAASQLRLERGAGEATARAGEKRGEKAVEDILDELSPQKLYGGSLYGGATLTSAQNAAARAIESLKMQFPDKAEALDDVLPALEAEWADLDPVDGGGAALTMAKQLIRRAMAEARTPRAPAQPQQQQPQQGPQPQPQAPSRNRAIDIYR